MPGFTSQDDMISEISTFGKTYRNDWNKSFLPTTAAVAGEWHCLARSQGSPTADALYNTGTNLAFQPVTDATANNSSFVHGGDVTTDYKHLLSASAVAATGTIVPFYLMLVDLIGFYRVTSVTTTTPQSLTNTLSVTNNFTADASTDVCTHTFYNLLAYTRVRLTTTVTLPAGLATATDYYVIKLTDTTCKLASSYANAVAGTAINITDAGTGTHTINTLLPRYTNGARVRPFMWNTNATPMGAATPNLSIGYTNAAQTGSRATPTTLPIGKTAAANGLVLYSGNGSGKYGPFMPLQAGDTGVAQVDTVTISVSYVSGEFSIGLAVPLMALPATTLGVATEREFVNQFPSLPRIYDGANLQLLMYSGANTATSTPMMGHLEFAWG
jgi:hypothetical protein